MSTPTVSRRGILTAVVAAPIALSFATAARAQEPAFYSDDAVAIRGADPVAYFIQGAPVYGTAEHTAEWNGTTWYFASAENRATFLADPEAYAPQYGGYCAWAVAQGYTASTVPEAWEIVEGKLYLNYSRRIQRRWARDIPGNISKGDANWPRVLE
ncbi:YHS domain-containing (seleno)protein [Pseudooctadecabacter jejudonensis]|uniref:YHS domain protein n=1 Tax=Pseudooctadecabacter jejudonensis TaxID=1391910 RepID=A0A1Y5RLN9_9RHOB|nr:YHS domain-containing (seleno)protein [Pseudooctadecabacter jejudonensis]SLN20428.1 YHS domain protein [Pseudooctadecabacter jejudonensis]